jgi:hypothetical protein
MQRDFNRLGVTGNRLVNAVVYNLLGKMIGPGGIGVHPGSLAYRFQTAEDFDI